MTTTVALWLSSLAVASLKGSLILIVALASLGLMRRSSAESRHAVLAIALVAFLVLPLASIVAPPWTVPALPAGVLERPSAEPEAPPPAVAPRAGERVLMISGVTANAAPFSTEHAGSVKPQPAPAARVLTALVAFAKTIGWAGALVALWIIGVAVIGLRLLVGIIRLRLLSSRATMVTDGGWLHTAHLLARRLGLTRGVTLLRGDREAVPMTWGVLSPVVWLPPAADSWPSDVRNAVLSHELAHVRRRDAATQWIANVAVALHWFNPLVWIAARALRAERERACDDAVLALGAAPDDYASQLLDMVRLLGRAAGPAPAMAMARRSQFEGRLLAILDRAVSRAPFGLSRLAAATTFAALMVIVLGGMRATAAAGSLATSVILRAPAVLVEAKRPSAAPRSEPVTRELTRPRMSPVAPMLTSQIIVPDRPTLGAVPPSPASLVRQLQGPSQTDTALLLAVISAAEGISSSSERVGVLLRVAARPDLDAQVVAALGEAAGRVASTTERTKLLSAIVKTQHHAVGASRRPVLNAIGTLSSSADQAAVLKLALKDSALPVDALADVLATAERITSSTSKADVLVAAARGRPIDGVAREAFVKAARTITTDSERARALAALFDGPGKEG
jgi:beta-lactamase regulating signal transducer with metallopeptidase domain